MYTNNELLFPNSVIPYIRNARGPQWRELVDEVTVLDNDHPRKLAFVYMMINLNGCLECETDSYRAMRGCRLCTLQTLRRFKDSDDELMTRYDEALARVEEYLEAGEVWRIA